MTLQAAGSQITYLQKSEEKITKKFGPRAQGISSWCCSRGALSEMLAPTFDILEDNIYTDDSSTSTSATLPKRSKSFGKKGLGIRSNGVAHFGNIQKRAGPQKQSLTRSTLQNVSFQNKKIKKKGLGGVGSTTKPRAFGAVLSTDNSNFASGNHSSKKKQLLTSFTAKIGPTPTQSKAKTVLRPRIGTTNKVKRVADIEVCHKGYGSTVPIDLDELDLLNTNEKAQMLYKKTAVMSMVPGVASGSCGPVIAPIDDVASFGIFEDDCDSDTLPKTGKDIDELSSMNLW